MTFHFTAKNGTIVAFSKRSAFHPPQVEEVPEKIITRVESEVVPEPSIILSKTKKDKGKDRKISIQEKKKNIKGYKSIALQESVQEKPSKQEILTNYVPGPEVPFFYDMRLSFPNSLTVETVVGTEDSDPFYIRQKYLTKGPVCDQIRDESYRCYLRNGNVLIFLLDGTVKILTPDSTIFLCKKFKKPPPPAPPPQQKPSYIVQPTESKTENENKKSRKRISTTSTDSPKKKRGSKTKKEKVDEYIPEETEEKIEVKEKSKNFQEDISKSPPLWEITDFDILTAHGMKYNVLNGEKKEIDDPLLLRTATDFEMGEVFTRREEGTNTLLTSDGILNVAYPDGTRISTIPQEMGEFEWSAEELKEIDRVAMSSFSKELSKDVGNKSTTNSPEELADVPLSELIESLVISELLKTASSGYYRSQVRDRALEPFVYISFSCRIDHPNYATVYYKAKNMGASILCPRNMKVKIDKKGVYKIKVGGDTNLEVNPMSITFESSVCSDCESLSRTLISLKGFLPEEKSDEIMSSTTDKFGNTFNVSYLGVATHHVPEKEDDTLTHECETISQAEEERYIVLQRDLSGMEFINTEDLQKYLALVDGQKYGYTNTDRVPGKSEQLKCYTTFMPVKETESGTWLTTIPLDSHLPTKLEKKRFTKIYIRTEKEKDIEEKLFASAVSQMPKEYLELYRVGLNPTSSPSSEEISISPTHTKYIEKFYKNLEQQKEHAEFYKQLLRTKSIPGYFDTIEGESFTTVRETVESAVGMAW
ncbi:hypothetical protein L9F63_020047 [Diploptera punctata]|uniref:Uncharacterized protein n=1 Tax=Diploptera punctata TaxID=6984 RepID=A0AAD7ZT10_DIPPU|nr:hypothetical protein L9F63_020047 [Diploptera punctata]